MGIKSLLSGLTATTAANLNSMEDNTTLDSTSIEKDQDCSIKLTDVELVSANESELSIINQFNIG